jgi:hypothetical protein
MRIFKEKTLRKPSYTYEHLNNFFFYITCSFSLSRGLKKIALCFKFFGNLYEINSLQPTIQKSIQKLYWVPEVHQVYSEQPRRNPESIKSINIEAVLPWVTSVYLRTHSKWEVNCLAANSKKAGFSPSNSADENVVFIFSAGLMWLYSVPWHFIWWSILLFSSSLFFDATFVLYAWELAD